MGCNDTTYNHSRRPLTPAQAEALTRRKEANAKRLLEHRLMARGVK